MGEGVESTSKITEVLGTCHHGRIVSPFTEISSLHLTNASLHLCVYTATTTAATNSHVL